MRKKQQSHLNREAPMNRADEVVATMHRDLAGAINWDNDREKFQTVSQRTKPEVRRSASRRFARFLVTICIGVAGTLAWQSYGETIKEVLPTRAPELGWSPESKQMVT